MLLAHVTWALAWEWALSSNSQNSYMGAYPGVGTFPGHYGICKYEIFLDFNLAVVKEDRQTAKFNSPPNFPAIWYKYYAVLRASRIVTIHPSV